MKILFIVLAILVILIAVVLVRAALLKPTAAKTAKVQLDNHSDRAKEYGERLAKMVRKETISSRFDPDRTKFYEFHEILEELFP